MIAITGATGQLGRLVINALLERIPASGVVALVRSPEKAHDLSLRGVEVRYADYSEPETLVSALAGIDRLLLISSNELGQRSAQHAAVIAAAKQAGVHLLAYTSVLRADTSLLELATEHRETEHTLKASGVPFVLLRNGWYHENYTAGVAAAVAHGVILGSAKEGRIASAGRVDYAEAAAVVLTGDGHAGHCYELAGDAAYSLDELAAEVARQSGKTVVYQDMPEADYKAALAGFGLPAPIAELLASSDAAAAQGALFDDGKVLSTLIGRPVTPIAAAVTAALA